MMAIFIQSYQFLCTSCVAYIGWAYEHEPDPRDGLLHLALVLVMEQGMDKEELERRELKHSIDPSIERALPHVLEGPDIWKLR